MPRPLTRDEVRAIDARAVSDFAIPTLILMENAGRGAADRIAAGLAEGARVAIACGAGNNGGDGAVVARHLDARGFAVRVAWFAPSEKFRGDALVQREIVDRSGIEAVELAEGALDDDLDRLWEGADLVVDALLGTGLARPVEPESLLGRAIRSINRSGRPVVALDLPSGLDADLGRPLGEAVKAGRTLTFAAPKIGFDRPGGIDWTGPVEVLDIGLPRRALEAFGG